MKRWNFLFLILLMNLMVGCGQQTAPVPEEPASPPVEETPVTEDPALDVPQMSVLSEENAPARKAYAAALKTLLDMNVLPDGTDCSDGYSGSIPERKTMAENQFSVYDVDGDGREELILLYTTAITAGEQGFVLDYDEKTETLHIQLSEYPALTFYADGAVMAGWSHNQGKGGAFWPYFLYVYDPDTDSYTQVGAVDAWDKTLVPEGYPTDIDVSNTGFVYYIYKDVAAEWDQIDPVDAAAYRAWIAPYLGDGEKLALPYTALTAENIHGLLAAG